jgi:hypothetical protein
VNDGPHPLTSKVITNAKERWDKIPLLSDELIPPAARFLNEARRIEWKEAASSGCMPKCGD